MKVPMIWEIMLVDEASLPVIASQSRLNSHTQNGRAETNEFPVIAAVFLPQLSNVGFLVKPFAILIGKVGSWRKLILTYSSS
jgi:hypothetical protein